MNQDQKTYVLSLGNGNYTNLLRKSLAYYTTYFERFPLTFDIFEMLLRWAGVKAPDSPLSSITFSAKELLILNNFTGFNNFPDRLL
jgi:hypothetical protein